MTSWHEKIAQQMGIKHSDTVAVVRWGSLAKWATKRRLRRKSKIDLKKRDQSDL